MKKKLLPIIMILILLMTAPVQALAAKPDMPDMETGLKYLNIGDSIAYGLSADYGESYFERYADYLDDNYGLDETWILPDGWPVLSRKNFPGAINLGLPGLDSMELMKAFNNEFTVADGAYYILQEQLKPLIKDADVITISIGGNNLLTPVIGTVATLYGVSPSGDFMSALLDKIAGSGEEVWEANLATFTDLAMMSIPKGMDIEQIIDDEYSPLGWLLEARTAQFLSDWPDILDAIEDVNPNAHIIAMTIYNPIEKDDNKDLYHRYEELVRPMNIAIMKTQNRAMVAKVEKAFAKEPDAVDFRLTWTWMEGPLPVLIDPHPTTLGHGIIFEELINQRNPRSIY